MNRNRKGNTSTLSKSKDRIDSLLSDDLLKDERLNYFTPEKRHAVWSQFDACEATSSFLGIISSVRQLEL